MFEQKSRVFNLGTGLARAFGSIPRVVGRFIFPTQSVNPWAGRRLPTFATLALVLAGCATGPNERAARMADWEREEKLTTAAAPIVPAAPVAPPATTPLPAQPAISAAPNPPAETWVPLTRWCKANGLSIPCPLAASSAPSRRAQSRVNSFSYR